MNNLESHTVHANGISYKFHIGDTLKGIGKRWASFAHVSGGVKKGTVSADMVNALRDSGRLEETCKWPLTYKVVELVKKDPKPNGQKYHEIHEELTFNESELDSIEKSQL